MNQYKPKITASVIGGENYPNCGYTKVYTDPLTNFSGDTVDCKQQKNDHTDSLQVLNFKASNVRYHCGGVNDQITLQYVDVVCR